jgi:hypothetical protein
MLKIKKTKNTYIIYYMLHFKYDTGIKIHTLTNINSTLKNYKSQTYLIRKIAPLKNTQ